MVSASLDTRHSPPPIPSLRALDWLNTFLAALLASFGPFVAVYLAESGWVAGTIGLVLSASVLAALVTQVPAGEFIDRVTYRRALIGAGAAAVGLAALILGLRPDFPYVFTAAVIQGAAGSVLGPAVAAISLGIVGHDALAERLGRNQRFASLGNLAASAIMGLIGYALSASYIFLLAPVLGLAVLLAVASIRPADIHFGRSCGASEHPTEVARTSRTGLFKDRRLLGFAACLFLFQLANASILPLVGEALVHTDVRHWSALVVSALVVVSQIVVALLAPWVGRTANTWGRRPLLLIGLGALPVRSFLFAFTTEPMLLVGLEVLDGVTAATLGVLTALVVADLTMGSGRFNLAQGVVAALSGVGALLSTSLSGLVVDWFGQAAGFLSMTAVALLALAACWSLVPETKPPAVN